MARLVDLVMGATEIFNLPDDIQLAELKESLLVCHKIVCDETVDYFRQKTFGDNPLNGSQKSIEIASFPCIRTPFIHLWMEYKGHDGLFGGAYIYFCPKKQTDDNDNDALVFCVLDGNKERITFVGGYLVFIDDTGIPIALRILHEMPDDSIFYYLCFSLSLLNMDTPLKDSPAYDAPLQKARQRRGKLPFFEYKILSLKPDQAKAKAKSIFSTVSTGGKNRRHSVRGHQRTYTPEKPMFGRKNGVGTFWIPEYITGSKDAGVISKDYVLKAPKPVESEKFQTKVVSPFFDT
jgi:hypothetical protein